MKSALIAALIAATPAEQAQRPCLTEAQVEDLALFAMPPLLEAAATKCAPLLPADAYLVTRGRELARTVAAQGAERWSRSGPALSRVSKDKFPSGLSDVTARGLIHDMALSEFFKKTDREQCRRIDRIADLLSPLPPANVAGLVIVFAEMATVSKVEDEPKGKAKDQAKAPKSFLCPAPRP